MLTSYCCCHKCCCCCAHEVERCITLNYLDFLILCLWCVFVTYYIPPRKNAKSTSNTKHFYRAFKTLLHCFCHFQGLSKESRKHLSLSQSQKGRIIFQHCVCTSFIWVVIWSKLCLLKKPVWVWCQALPTPIHLEWLVVVVRAKKEAFFHLSEWKKKGKGKTQLLSSLPFLILLLKSFCVLPSLQTIQNLVALSLLHFIFQVPRDFHLKLSFLDNHCNAV